MIFLALAAVYLHVDSVKIVPTLVVGVKQSVRFEVKAQVANEAADLAGTAVLNISKADSSGAEMSIDWKNIVFSSNGAETDLPFSPYKVSLGPDGNLTNVDGGTSASDPVRTVLITFFPKPPSELELNKALDFALPAQKGGVPGMKITETYEGPDLVGALKAYKVLVKVQETGAQSQNFRLDSTFWVDQTGAVLREDGKFANLPVTGAGTSADGTITAKVLGAL